MDRAGIHAVLRHHKPVRVGLFSNDPIEIALLACSCGDWSGMGESLFDDHRAAMIVDTFSVTAS